MDNKISYGKNNKTIKLKNETSWSSIHIICLLAFSSSVQFTLYFSSTNQFLKTFDPDATEFFYGIIISSYSIGNVVFSPIMGYASNRIKQIKILLYVGLICQFIGNLIYFFVEILPFDNKKIFLIIARLITGIGASNVSLMKAYISGASTQEDRSRCIAYITGAMAVGAFIGPALQLFFTPFGYPGIHVYNLFRIHMFNLPALGACIFVFVNFILVYFIFKEVYVDIIESTKDEKSNIPPYDIIAALICYLTRFCQTFISTNLETLAAVISISVFSYTTTESVNIISIANTGRAILALIISLLYVFIKLEKYISTRCTIIICILSMLLFHGITYPYGFYNKVPTYNTTINFSNETYVGCNLSKYSWCKNLSPCNPYLYYISHTTIVGISYSALNICLNTLFSKIIGPRRQAFQQGTLNMSKGISQMLSPPLIGLAFDYSGQSLVWIIHILVVGGTASLWFLFYNRMVPLINETDNITISSISYDLSVLNQDGSDKSITKPISDKISRSLTRVAELYPNKGSI
uniref:MFS domain-containing protein n=1 Tax=Parastrongyloides trichosuri TaxID=131310 RepID=A0A0N4ZMV4_PARTI